MAIDENMPAVKHYHQREYSGMFEYRKEDEMLIIKNLIIGDILTSRNFIITTIYSFFHL